MQIGKAEIIAADLLVSLCIVLTDSDDPRPWLDRLDGFFSQIPDEDVEVLVQCVADGRAEALLKDVERRLKGPGYKAFVSRLLGAAEYRAMLVAAKADGAVLALGVRRAIRAAMPFAVAWSDALGVMSKAQLRAATRFDSEALNAVQIVVQVDAFFGEKVLAALPMQATSATKDDLATWEPQKAPQFMQKFRALISEGTAKKVERANSPLVKKIKGARHALQFSEDGISQAANSLTELIDRIMREAFSHEQSLAWVQANYKDLSRLTHVRDGVLKLTKLGEALCFVHGGGSPVQAPAGADQTGSFVHDVLARVIVNARNKLQELKHADAGTEEEREQLLRVLAAIEGALMLGLSLGRVSADQSDSEAA
ncbi:hypothetical protein ACFXG8_19050 [Kitasatospora indigofera]|uniref:hypothetical protein n=1 Tax=Kitasatospora indigofera TaxID=67307 RepID=UPI0036B7244B